MSINNRSVGTDLSLVLFSLVGLAWISSEKCSNQQRKSLTSQATVEEVVESNEGAGYYDHIYLIKFPHFIRFGAAKGAAVCSPTFECFGLEWKLRLNPGGSTKSSDGMMSVFLRPLFAGQITLNYRFVLRDHSGGTYDTSTTNGGCFNGSSKGWSNWLNREEVVAECLDREGTLTIEVHMRHVVSQNAIVVHKGVCPQGFDMFSMTIPNFASVPKTKGIYIDAPVFGCFGKEWKLELYPGGYGEAKKGMMSALLHPLDSDQSIALDYKILIRDIRGDLFHIRVHSEEEFEARCNGIVTHDFIMFEQIISSSSSILVDGSLTIELHMNVYGCQKSTVLPKNPFEGDVYELCLETTPNVSFAVSGSKGNTTTFHAHLSILERYAPMLAGLCGDNDNATAVPITDVEPEVYRWFLRYIYGGVIPPEELKSHAKEFIHAANKYDVPNLKLEAEAAFVKQHKFTADDAMDTFLYADSKNLALLKEAAMNFIHTNAEEMLASTSFKDNTPVDPIILKELLSIVATKNVGICATKNEAMSVNTLRFKLLKKGLDIDGSREVLIARLEYALDEEHQELLDLF